MYLALGVVCVAISTLAIFLWIHRKRDLDVMERHMITAQELHTLLASDKKVPLFDVRQPLDLLAYPEIIPGAKRIPPEEVLERPSLIPKENEVVVYCTCRGDKTSRTVVHRALAMQFSRIKFLRGGLAAWKANGYPVEPYREVFHLYDPPPAARSG
ncbi:MAG TPA: rhodanese-like domain-containing protein [Terriglobales bacterium]|nr:rhodanese-like domain-containing protein [Terriglobales bacterium]